MIALSWSPLSEDTINQTFGDTVAFENTGFEVKCLSTWINVKMAVTFNT